MKVKMAYFRSCWSHLDISTTICQHQLAAVGFELTTPGFRGMAPTHCTIGVDYVCVEEDKTKTTAMTS